MLEQNEVCASIVSVSEEKLVVDPQSETTTVGEPLPESDGNSDEPDCNELHVALTQAAVRKYTNICLALLDIGANPNHNGHKGRFGKVSGRLERKMKFYSSPLHLACIIGDDMLVHGLLFKGAEYNRPDACGMFPLHHVAAGDSSTGYSLEDDSCRKKCLDYLLKAGAALSMKDGQKQTVLHVAARAGRQGFLQYVMQHWNKMVVKDPRKVGSLEWRDTWSRTPVHWAVLNNHIVTLKILLDNGCNPCPVKVKASTSSLTPETPIEICDRIYGSSDTGEQIRKLLLQHSLPP
jgi:ankyrin repeat protein